jgi:putative membrane protein insertion efficiency factor
MTRLSRTLLPAVRLVFRAYKRLVSPLFGNRCRFHPTCADYALEAFETYGIARGAWLAARRLVRCHSLNPGGFDPVPRSTTVQQKGPGSVVTLSHSRIK